MQYHFETYDRELARMESMVRKLYPDFCKDRDYCLWLVFAYFEGARYDITPTRQWSR